jgi:hypothetical protein
MLEIFIFWFLKKLLVDLRRFTLQPLMTSFPTRDKNGNLFFIWSALSSSHALVLKQGQLTFVRRQYKL